MAGSNRVIVRPRLEPRSFFVFKEKMHAREERNRSRLPRGSTLIPLPPPPSSSSTATCLLRASSKLSFRSPPILFILFQTNRFSFFLTSSSSFILLGMYRTVFADRILPVFAAPLYISPYVSGSRDLDREIASREILHSVRE